MKYVLIIIDGAADLPIDELGGQTPLQAADLPAMAEVASRGVIGRLTTCPAQLPCGSDVAIMSVFGYDPALYYTGRAPIEAMAQGISLEAKDWVLRANLVTIQDGLMKDHSAKNIPQADAEKIIELLNREVAQPGFRFYPGVSYRNLLLVKQELTVQTTPPHDILEKRIDEYLPRGPSADFLIGLMKRCKKAIATQPINSHATDVWLWGQGQKPNLPSFKERFGLKGAVITGVDLVRGLAHLIGWDIIKVPGVTAYFDTNYQGKGEYAIKALDKYDLVCVHIEAPDEAGHLGNWQEKIKALKNIDAYIVRPLLNYLQRQDLPWRLCLLPDHPTPCKVRTHTHEAVPFAICFSDEKHSRDITFSERAAAESSLFFQAGHQLMPAFLTAPSLSEFMP